MFLSRDQVKDNIFWTAGESTLPFDKWFGTFRDGLPDGEGAALKGEHKDDRKSAS